MNSSKSNLMRIKAAELTKRAKVAPATTGKRPGPQVSVRSTLLKDYRPKRLLAIVNGK